MAINRRFLYAGLFLVALGGVLVLVDLAAVDTAAVSSALRLWPLAIIAIGAGIVFRRSRYALVAGVLAAMIPGLVLGGGLAVAPRHAMDCGAGNKDAQTSSAGEFSGPAVVRVEANCGSISIDTRPGNAWQLTTSVKLGRTADVLATENELTVGSTGDSGWSWLDDRRDLWNLTLPTSRLESLGVELNAGRATLSLPGANVGTLQLTGNAADVGADLSTTLVTEVNGSLDLGRLSIQLPEHGGYSGAFRIGAGQLRLCLPYLLGVHVDFAGTPREVRVNGLVTDARSWENDLYQTSTNRADLSVKVNFGSVLINPIGGCK